MKNFLSFLLRKAIKEFKNDGLSEDMAKDAEDDIQKLTDNYISTVNNLVAIKETDIMKV